MCAVLSLIPVNRPERTHLTSSGLCDAMFCASCSVLMLMPQAPEEAGFVGRSADRLGRLPGIGGGRCGSLPRGRLPALRGAFLPQRALARAAQESACRSGHAQGDEAGRGGRARRRRDRGDADVLLVPIPALIKLKTNNPVERLLREACRRTKVVGAFPDGQSALMLVAARLRYVSTTQWGLRKYMNVGLLKEMDREVDYAAA